MVLKAWAAESKSNNTVLKKSKKKRGDNYILNTGWRIWNRSLYSLSLSLYSLSPSLYGLKSKSVQSKAKSVQSKSVQSKSKYVNSPSPWSTRLSLYSSGSSLCGPSPSPNQSMYSSRSSPSF